MERIAAAAKVNKQLLFHYFNSKEGLFSAAVAAMLARLEPRVASAGTPLEHVKRLAEELVALVEACPGIARIASECSSGISTPPAVAKQVFAWRDGLGERMRRAVVDGQRRGYFRDDVDPHAVVGVAMSAAMGRATLGLVGSSIGGVTDPKTFGDCLGKMLVDYCAWR